MSMSISSYVCADTGISRFRATWWHDPATSIAIGWESSQDVQSLRMLYWERNLSRNIQKVNPEQSKVSNNTFWVFLTSLKPNTEYSFELRWTINGKEKQSQPLWFKTAPDHPQSIRLISGGDSRNNRKVRRALNRIVAELAPLAVLFNGDFTARGTVNEWKRWLDDWSLTTSSTGRLIPIIPAMGNHDDLKTLRFIFGEGFDQFYYLRTFGGSLLSLYTLNSELPAGGNQLQWFTKTLTTRKHSSSTWRFAQYHKPMRPHFLYKREGQDEYHHWAQLFTKFHFELVMESDSHLMKVTYPLIYDPDGEEGFSPVMTHNTSGTIYIGEGGWGAPLRTVNDSKTWTKYSARSHHFYLLEFNQKELKIIPIILHSDLSWSQGEKDKRKPWHSSPSLVEEITDVE